MTTSAEIAELVEFCYSMEPGDLWEVEAPLPGYRVETVTADGRIGAYENDGHTRRAHHDWRYQYKAATVMDVMRISQANAASPALIHDSQCTSCGHRIVRSRKELADFIVSVAESSAGQSVFLNHAYHSDRDTYVAIVECAVPPGGLVAFRNLRDGELSGTIRTDRLQLGGTVTLPRFWGSKDQRGIADKIRERYGVKVRLTRRDALALVNSFTPRGRSGNGWHSCGQWGLYGAAGVFFTSGTPDNPRFLLIQRNRGLPNFPGLWGTPGGAVDEKETSLQAATREIQEELGVTSLAGASIAGASVYTRSGGWSYTTYLAYVPAPFEPTIDGGETVAARWVTRSELEAMSTAGELVGPFAEKLPALLDLRRTWEQSQPDCENTMRKEPK